MPPQQIPNHQHHRRSYTTTSPHNVVKDYLLTRVEFFGELLSNRRKIRDDPRADECFKSRQVKADNADSTAREKFYKMMCKIGEDLQASTSALSLPSVGGRHPRILDLCMAPGGFTSAAMRQNWNATVRGITLPPEDGGHPIMIPNWQKHDRIIVEFMDITMLASEMDVTSLPRDHVDFDQFITERPFPGQEFDLVFCDGQVLRNHVRSEYRESREASRLLTSQLVLALQRVRRGGKLVMLLHQVDSWDTVHLLYTLDKFSSLKLFKPMKAHGTKSSFYVIAEDIQPQSEDAIYAVETWKEEWRTATGGTDEEYKRNRHSMDVHVNDVLLNFGARFIQLSQPIWRTQNEELRSFIEKHLP